MAQNDNELSVLRITIHDLWVKQSLKGRATSAFSSFHALRAADAERIIFRATLERYTSDHDAFREGVSIRPCLLL